MNRDKRYKILNEFKRYNPNPIIELTYCSSFELLIAVLLSAQSKDEQVNKVTKRLFIIANTPQAMLSLGVSGIAGYIKSIGLYNIKAKNIFNACRMILEKHHGLIPESRDLLEELPGIGRKSANVLLNVIFNWPVIAVDTHVFRFCNRTRFAVGSTVKEVEKKLLKVVPDVFKIKVHHWFVLHGRYVCKSKKPLCNICYISNLCEFPRKFYFLFCCDFIFF